MTMAMPSASSSMVASMATSMAASMATSMSAADMSTAMSPMMYFTFSSSTPLYNMSWTPSTSAGYAGTCIFLILLATGARFLLAGKHALEARWRRIEGQRRAIIVRGRAVGNVDGKRVETEPTVREETDSGSEKDDVVVQEGVLGATTERSHRIVPWRLSVDVPRAAYVCLLATVGYLLMLAVMTMNVGYFMSVLGGIFLGELLVGRYVVAEHFDHAFHL